MESLHHSFFGNDFVGFKRCISNVARFTEFGTLSRELALRMYVKLINNAIKLTIGGLV